ncbi:VapC toxin family PIN domain ribonuclease [Candidatus Poribacteria bacterium]|nr:MAG: VapC toxin family PIN domain ribonuclease [Candidatus Poribacteria bacterium]
MVRTNNADRIIDTDILIDASKENQDSINFLTIQQEAGIQISIISAIELVVGCRNKTELSQTQKFLQSCTILPITVAASEVAYQLIETFALSHGLLMGDALIAATVLELDATLYTKNTRHFQMIPRLAIIRPY